MIPINDKPNHSRIIMAIHNLKRKEAVESNDRLHSEEFRHIE